MRSEEFQRGYEAAYNEIYAAIKSADHPTNCGGCRACDVFRALLTDIQEDMRRTLSQDEIDTVNAIMSKAIAALPPGDFTS